MASGYSSDSSPSLGTSICRGCGSKKKKLFKIQAMDEETNSHDDKQEWCFDKTKPGNFYEIAFYNFKPVCLRVYDSKLALCFPGTAMT